MNARFLALASMALLVAFSGNAQTSPARQPFGIYARLDTTDCVGASGPNAATYDCISNSAAELLTNPAVSGICAFVRWTDNSVTLGETNTSILGTNYWYMLDGLFDAVSNYNASNSTNPPKTVQLGFQPGFHTPQWAFNQLVSCDPIFSNSPPDLGAVPSTCGCVTFLGGEGTDVKERPELLPLPWNPTYTNLWSRFIHSVAQKYGANPLLVSVAVAGPTSDSDEIILPNESNNPTNYWKWNYLFALTFPTNYQNTDQAFIEAWERAIDMYGDAFSNLTLVVTTGNGLPNFTNAQGAPYPNTYAIPPGFEPDCGKGNDSANIMDAAAESTILAYFADPKHGGNNAKAVQESGFRANDINNNPLGPADLSSQGVKWLAQSSESGSAILQGSTNVISRILGGLQFDNSFVKDPSKEGCNSSDCSSNNPPTCEQACYNVLEVFFDGTAFGAAYGTNTISGTIPMNYMQIYSEDLFYANTNNTGSIVTNGFGKTNIMTVTELLTNASQQLFQTAEAVLYIQSASNNIQVLWPATAGGAGYQLQVNNDLAKPDTWKTNANSSAPVLTNGFYQVQINTGASAKFYRLSSQ